jgi:integrase
MSTVKILSSGSAQVRVTNKLLGKPYYATFDTAEQAQAYGEHLDRLLAQGIVPVALLERPQAQQASWALARCMLEYVKENHVPVSDQKLLDTIRPHLASQATAHLNYDWAECWIREMKRVHNLAPSTIRHRHGALARCFDWMLRKHPEVMVQNPLRLLKRGFASYTEADRLVMQASGKNIKEDVQRDRRLEPGEEPRIVAAMIDLPDERAMFTTALESVMRLRECYTLLVTQVVLRERTIYLERTKNGDNRQVPMTSVLTAMLGEYLDSRRADIRARDGRVFPFWNGNLDERNLDATTSELSRRYQDIFARAGVVDFRFHDLRHEATCRLYLRTNLTDVQISRITGHKDPRQLKRYASLRGSDLAARLW